MGKKNNLILVFLFLNGILATGTAYAWNKITYLPHWYNHNSGESVSLQEGEPNLLKVKLDTGKGVSHGENNQVNISLNETELTALMTQRLAQTPKTAQVLQATKGIKASIKGEQVSGGMVVQPSQLPDRARHMVQQVLPMVGDRPIYISVNGSPTVQNGRIFLSDNTQVNLGSVSLSLADITRLTGLSKSAINQQVNLAVSEAGLSVDSIELVNGELMLRGTKTKLTAQDIKNLIDR
jgi:hypothetical protein